MPTNAPGLVRVTLGTPNNASSKKPSPSTALPRCVTCQTWVSRCEGNRLTQPPLSRHNNQRHPASSNNLGRHLQQRNPKPWLRRTPVTLQVVGPISSGRSGGGVFLLLLPWSFLGCLHRSDSFMTISFSPALETRRRGLISGVIYFLPTYPRFHVS